ncbi:carboxymuconolactone decarboxylase family protein [Enterovirga rhinocerotis]|uniref:AhpD family alkylhydroperoxidase n=1 Tax=Enterovirga rhinocerotis TaxID=1339210 RepID=A0A4R7CAE9_9HYPH|nr:carboxymuconolactone decarboxylase family protein [Enterovirga rhinocerotis]TDR93767.1 AhpD family alkylhydroperoxidase [Enterovirga rhinocerotis]
MTRRINPYGQHPDLVKPLIDFATTVQAMLEPSLMELVKIRASQINACAYCLRMHTTEARAMGESEERIYMLDAWRESGLYSERERAALGWTEALTQLSPHGVPDEARMALAATFTEEEQVKLTLMIVAINGFNRINVGFGITDRTPLPRKAA